jgi:hypothetical protein
MRRINLLLWPSVQHLDISTTFYLSTTSISIHMLIPYTPVNLKIKIPQNRLLLLHTWTFHFLKKSWRKTNNSVVRQTGWFQFCHCQLPILHVTSHYHLHMVYISLNWFDMQGPALHTISFWVGVDYWQTSWCYRDSYSLVWCQCFVSSMAISMIWFIIIN